MNTEKEICPVFWQDDVLVMLDQRLLPSQETYIRLQTVHEVTQAIRDMVVRGAPAIGIAAAYGVVLAARQCYSSGVENWRQGIGPCIQELAAARPTAVNLQWAITRMCKRFDGLQGDPEPALLEEAKAILDEDISANRLMGRLGAEIIGPATAVLTHCNAGALATGGYGTALGVIRSLFRSASLSMVYACETRPWLQGARLTAWELSRDSIPVTLITDSTAASLMQTGRIEWVIVGADRVAANGDVANKIGTYSHAVSARHHGTRFMVVAPASTIDMATGSGDQVLVEERNGRELTHILGRETAPDSINIYNPVFDITPAGLVDFLVTEKGVIERPDRAKIEALMDAGKKA